MQTRIRQALQSDLPYLYTICLQTGDSGNDATGLFSDPWLIGHYYAAPYLFRDISLCFIVEGDGIPMGYIIGTDDTPAFNAWLESVWLPPLRERYAGYLDKPGVVTETERNLIDNICRPATAPDPALLPLIADFPAHLHIDLLPVIQGKGLGRQLVETLSSALKAKRCPGVHLGVSARNVGAIRFYLKVGFSVLVDDEWGKVMGLRF